MRERLQSEADSMETDEGDMFEDEKLELRLNMARSCLQQNNFTLALRILKETFSVSVALGAVSVWSSWAMFWPWNNLYS